ncbi:MAG: RNA methyltransferase [Leptospira sp.]|nr:RNA methyltransferase [Leptospira sp.]
MQDSPHYKKTTIESISSDLRGIGFIDEKEYLFRYVNIGDEVTFQERGRGKRKHTVISEIDRKTPIIAPCKHFTECGGCAGQHISYENQFQYKTKPIAEKFETEYSKTPELVYAEKIYGQRNRMDFGVFPGPIVGLHPAGNFRRITDIENCLIQNEFANSELEIFRKLITEFPDIAQDRKKESGFLKYITLRNGINTGDNLNIFTFSEGFENSIREKEFEDAVLKNSKAENIVFCYNRRKAEVSASGKFKTIRGNHFYKEEILGKKFDIPFDSFFQPNPSGFLPILNFIKERIGSFDTDTLIDFFCGTGFFSRIFGDKFKTLHGFEFTESAVTEAVKILANEFPEKEIHFEKADLLQMKESLVSAIGDMGNASVILDPPRNGAGRKLMEFLGQSEAKEIFYVSCNPHSQLADLEFISGNFAIRDVLITDPYPHTPHLESVVWLVKRIDREL